MKRTKKDRAEAERATAIFMLKLGVVVFSIFLAVSVWMVWPKSSGSNEPEMLDTESSRNDPAMTREMRQRYDGLSTEGQAHVDDQMKKYDEFCAKYPRDC